MGADSILKLQIEFSMIHNIILESLVIVCTVHFPYFWHIYFTHFRHRRKMLLNFTKEKNCSELHITRKIKEEKKKKN